MKTKAVKFKHLFITGGAKVLIIPDLWLRELNWDKDTELVLEYHPYKKEVLITEDYRNISTKKKVKEVELEEVSSPEPTRY